ncbi:GNAT family N-acetyltransferase [Streptomyces sp. NPDC057697]|uniref:GNAT family N-acetyltransferase n=1 Tax=Streptomyces sp. NPDC057697 TaxID=3346219 RepID=UPI0036A12A23
MVLIREMTPDDVDAVAEVRVRGWQTAYAGLVPRSHLDSMSVAEDARQRRALLERGGGTMANWVAERGGEVVGWACFGPHRESEGPPRGGELYAMYVLPEQRSTGVGRALMEAVVAETRRRGLPWVRLWVLKENASGRRFYERAGFRPDGHEESSAIDGTPVPEVRYELSLTRATPQP